jgi:hypothetical protein
MLTRRLLRTLSMSFILTAGLAHGAHWTLVSMGTSNTPFAPTGTGDYVDTVLGQASATIPSGNSNGSGTFQFYGDKAAFGTNSSKYFYGYQGSWSPNDSSTRYFKFEYKWVADSPSDVPPNVGSAVSVLRYSLQHASYFAQVNTVGSNGLVVGNASDSAVFNALGPIPASWAWTQQLNVSNVSDTEPSSGQPPQLTTIGSNTFFITGADWGGQTVQMDGSNYVVIFYPVSAQAMSGSITGSDTNPYSYNELFLKDTQMFYQGASEIGGLPVQ